MLKRTLLATLASTALLSAGAIAQTTTETSPSDGRSGGTGVPSAVSGATPSTAADVTVRHPWQEAWWGYGDSRWSEYSLTDGRSGGTGVPSAVSGATPSTAPAEDLQRLRAGDHASLTGMPRYSWLDQSRYVR
jgi:hypothetical protein